jgi:membrane protein implicated in regulation of membrane protease activity
VIALYLAALLLAVGAVLVQVLGTHDTGAGGHDGSHTGFDDHDFAPWMLITSVRFWSFGLLAFGLVGTLLTWFGLAGVGGAAAIATLSGVAGGAFAATAVRRMMRRSASSHVTSGDVVGKVGRVLVPPSELGRGKVRVEIKGNVVDYVARAGEALTEGDVVVIEECEGEEVTVSRAPRELKP